MSTNDERAKDAEALGVMDAVAKTLYSEFATIRNPNPEVLLLAARAHLAARLDSLAGEVEQGREISSLHAGVLLALGTILELPEGVPLKDAIYVDAVISLRHRAESAERERDALAAELARVRELPENWRQMGGELTRDDDYYRGFGDSLKFCADELDAALAAKPKGEL
jgi:hypothetical protein